MISFDHTLISNDLKEVFFRCDLERCKGACCVEGDAGAPLEKEEISLLENYLEEILPFMTAGGVQEVKAGGVSGVDSAGNLVTPLINGGACAYICFEGEIARCAIEQAYRQQKIPFPKPLSCHLYPVRITCLDGGDAVNYHKWSICNKALERGYREKLPLYQFLQDALIRKYGRGWFNRLVKQIR